MASTHLHCLSVLWWVSVSINW